MAPPSKRVRFALFFFRRILLHFWLLIKPHISIKNGLPQVLFYLISDQLIQMDYKPLQSFCCKAEASKNWKCPFDEDFKQCKTRNEK